MFLKFFPSETFLWQEYVAYSIQNKYFEIEKYESWKIDFKANRMYSGSDTTAFRSALLWTGLERFARFTARRRGVTSGPG